jgi:hypothetical protein
MSRNAAKQIFSFYVKLCTRVTFGQVEAEFADQRVDGFDRYLSSVKRAYDLEGWQILIFLVVLVFFVCLMNALFSS